MRKIPEVIKVKIALIVDAQLKDHPLLADQRPKILNGLYNYYRNTGKIPRFEIEEANDMKARKAREAMKVVK